MLERRDAIKLTVAGLLWPLLARSTHRSHAQSASGAVSMFDVSISPTGHMPGPAPSLDAPVAIKWRFHHNGSRTGSVIVAEGTVFLASDDGYLYAIDAETGVERWRFSIGVDSVSTPAYADGRVFTATTGNAFYALNATSGQVDWQFTAPEWEGLSDDSLSVFWTNIHVSVYENLVMVQSAITGLHAFEGATGVEQWRIPWDGNPKIADNMLITDSRDYNGYDPTTATQNWTVDDDRNRRTLAVSDGFLVVWMGAPGSERAFAPGSTLEVLNPQTGARIWSLEDRFDYLRSAVIVDDLVIVEFVGAFDPTDEEVLAFDLATGQERWQVQFFGATSLINTPMIAIDDILYRLRGDNHLVAHDVATGNERWALPVAAPVNLGSSRLAVVDGVVFVSGDDGVLYALANQKPAILIDDVTLRGAPSQTGVERGTAQSGTEITHVGARNSSSGQEWLEVTIGDMTGWIPATAIDPATLPAEGEFEYVYIPGQVTISPPSNTGDSGSIGTSAASSSTGSDGGIQPNGRVEVVEPMNVRPSAGTSGDPLWVVDAGEQGVVIAGPIDADGYIWWEVVFDNGSSGFVVDDFLIGTP